MNEKNILIVEDEIKIANILKDTELIDQVQGYSFEGYDRTVDSHIKNLRKKIAAHYSEQEIIHSVYGVGYKIG